MQKKKNTATITGLFFILAALLLAVALNSLSYRKNVTQIFINSERFIAHSLADQMDNALQFGKPIQRFYGVDELLGNAMHSSDNILAIWIVSDQGETLYSMPAGYDTNLYTLEEDMLYRDMAGGYYTQRAFAGDNQIGLLLDKTEVNAQTRDYIASILAYAAAGLVAGLVILLVFRQKDKRKIIVAIAVAQLVFGALVVTSYNAAYKSSLHKIVALVSDTIQIDIDKLAAVGIGPEEYIDFDVYLADMASRVPELAGIEQGSGGKDHLPLQTTLPLYATTNQEIITRQIVAYVVDTLILIAVTVFLMLEFLFYTTAKNAGGDERKTAPPRLLIFLLYVGVSMGASFVAAVAFRHCRDEGLPGLVSLPITVEMIVGLVGVLLSGVILDKLDYKRTFILCMVICSVGIVLSALAANVYVFTVGRAVVGFGFSLITITGRVFAASQKDDTTRSRMLAALTGGSLIGYCCGVVIGGLLSDRFAYSIVFYISIGFILTGLPVLRRLSFDTKADAFTMGSLRKSLLGRGSLLYLLFMVMPIYAGGMFVAYALPLYGAKSAIPTTIISALLMLNSLLAAYLSPLLTDRIKNRLGVKRGVLLYGALTVLSLLVAVFFDNLAVIVLVTMLLGVADSFGLVLLIEGFGQRGSSSMIAITLTGKAGQAAAPPLLAAGSPIWLAVAAFAGTVLYTLMNHKQTTREE